MQQHQHIFVTNSQVCFTQSLLQGGHSLEKTLTLYRNSHSENLQGKKWNYVLCSMYTCTKYDISSTVFHQEHISMGSLSKSVYFVKFETGENLPKVLKIIRSARHEPLLPSTGPVFYFSTILSGLWAPT